MVKYTNSNDEQPWMIQLFVNHPCHVYHHNSLSRTTAKNGGGFLMEISHDLFWDFSLQYWIPVGVHYLNPYSVFVYNNIQRIKPWKKVNPDIQRLFDRLNTGLSCLRSLPLPSWTTQTFVPKYHVWTLTQSLFIYEKHISESIIIIYHNQYLSIIHHIVQKTWHISESKSSTPSHSRPRSRARVQPSLHGFPDPESRWLVTPPAWGAPTHGDVHWHRKIAGKPTMVIK